MSVKVSQGWCLTYRNRCIEWNLGSSVSLSRPIEVCRLSLGKAFPVDSSSESLSLKMELILLGRLTLLLPMLDCVVVDSEVSRLLGFGVTMPPPSTEIGMINSLGDFLIGCLSDETVDVDCANDWVGVVSLSFESFVDCRERGFLWTIEIIDRNQLFFKRRPIFTCTSLSWMFSDMLAAFERVRCVPFLVDPNLSSDFAM